MRGEGGLGLVISDEGGVVKIGSDSFGENAFGKGGKKGVESVEGIACKPKPRRSVGKDTAAGDVIAQVEALSKFDKSVSSVECLQRSFHLGGSDPFLTASRVVKLSSNVRWN